MTGVSSTGQQGTTFDFRFAPSYRRLSWLFGVTERTALVTLTDHELLARFGPWHVTVALTNVRSVKITGPYRLLKAAGPARLSLSDRGLTMATNGDQGVCLSFHEPIAGIEPTGRLRHPGLTLTVADCAGLAEAVSRGA